MYEFARWLTGFVLMVVFEMCTIDMTASQKCNTTAAVELWPFIETYGYNGIGADCSLIDLKELPDDLPANIQVLFLSENHNLNLRNDSFQKYTELIIVIMDHMSTTRNGRGPVHDESTFLPLTKLKELLLTDSGFFHVKFKFPNSIERLFIDGNSINERDLDLSQLASLNTLSAIKSGFDDIPVVHELAPLTSLAIGETSLLMPLPENGENSPLSKLTAESLATFCLLERLHINMTLTPPITWDNFCRCSRLEKWLSYQVQEGSISTKTLIVIDCGRSHSDIVCNYDFTNAFTIRNQCLKKHKDSSWVLWMVLLIGMISLPVVIIAYVWFSISSGSGGMGDEEASTQEEITPTPNAEITEEDENN